MAKIGLPRNLRILILLSWRKCKLWKKHRRCSFQMLLVCRNKNFRYKCWRIIVDNENYKLDYTLVSNEEITIKLQDIFCKNAGKNITYKWASIQKFSCNGMDQDDTQENSNMVGLIPRWILENGTITGIAQEQANILISKLIYFTFFLNIYINWSCYQTIWFLRFSFLIDTF